ncbi:NADAR family protein [Deinococcus ficus]|uniref:NADAR domain-containing protein n=1 Tax=Deinococcus ficus TaxID=317577 RepID=A0A221T307_9DEIO|nr:NADAR family protein [Deinococcus ficus]ASN83273.1 hypothetical protein DFI_18925 [Deinococcus ficus]
MKRFPVSIPGVTVYAPDAAEVRSWLNLHPRLIAGTGHRPNKFPKRSATRLPELTTRFLRDNPQWQKYDPMGLYDPRGWAAAVVFAAGWLAGRKVDAVIAGGAIGWDQILAEAALMLGLPLLIAIPFQTQDSMWPRHVREVWLAQLRRADRVVCVTDVHDILTPGARSTRDLDPQGMKDAMDRRNKFMTVHLHRHMDVLPDLFVVALHDGSSGGTGNCVRDCRAAKLPMTSVYADFLAELCPTTTARAKTPPAAPVPLFSPEPAGIRGFQGEYRWLSNFWRLSRPVKLSGIEFWTVEAAYQAAKTLDLDDRRHLATLDPGDAKRYGRTVKMRPDWDSIKLDVMTQLTRHKFRDPALRTRLLSTGTLQITEENTWGDTFWGVSRGKGQNHLGQILMALRHEIANEQQAQ